MYLFKVWQMQYEANLGKLRAATRDDPCKFVVAASMVFVVDEHPASSLIERVGEVEVLE